MTALSLPGGLVAPVVSRPPALEPPATLLFPPTSLQLSAVVFPELPFPPDPATVPGPRVAVAEPDPFAPEATPRSALPDPVMHVRRLVLAALEAVAGRRPVQQLMPHLTETAYQHLAERLRHARPTATPGRSAHVTVFGPNPRTRGTPDHRSTGRTRIHIGRAVICEPADGIIEATVLARWGARTIAAAVRLEGIDGRWRCPVLTIL